MAEVCYRCHAKGHICAATDTDPENGRPICIFCADNEPCPIVKRMSAAPTPATAPAADKKPKAAKPEASKHETRTCAAPGCTNTFTPRQETHLTCSKKCYQRYWHQKSNPKLKCGKCGGTMRKDSKFPTCLKCRQAGLPAPSPKHEYPSIRKGRIMKTKAKAKPSPRAQQKKQIARPSVAETAKKFVDDLPFVATLCVTEAQMNRFFAALKPEDKAEALQGLFDRMEG